MQRRLTQDMNSAALSTPIGSRTKADCGTEAKWSQARHRSLQRPFQSVAVANVLALIGVVTWPSSPRRSGERYDIAIFELGEKSADEAEAGSGSPALRSAMT